MKKIMLSICVIGLLASCKKDDDDDRVCDFSQSNFVGTYKVTSVAYKADSSTPEEDEFSTWDACEKDDLIIFNSNNTITYQDVGTICTPNGNDVGIWSYVNSNTVNINGDITTVTSFNCDGGIFTIAGTDPGEYTRITLDRQ